MRKNSAPRRASWDASGKPRGQTRQRGDEEHPGGDISEDQRSRIAVVRDQPTRPDRQREIVRDHDALIEEVGPRTNARAEAHRAGGRTRDRRDHKHQPGHCQRRVETPPAAKRVRERIEEEDPIDEDHGHGNGHHRLLTRHSQGAREHGGDEPSSRTCRGVRANTGIESQEVEERHHQLGPLTQVIDRLGIQRMQHPQRCAGKSKDDGMIDAADEAEQHEGAQNVDGDVADVVSADAQAADGVVDRKGKGHQRAADDG